MEESEETGFEVREEFMISSNGGPKPTKRLAQFLKPCTNSFKGQVFDIPSHCFSSLPPVFEPKKWPLNVNFHGWRPPQKYWKAWVGKMAVLHESTWKQAGIYEAILNSVYEIRRNYDLVHGLAEKWCPETKSFIFSWGEATITLEDVMNAGYSVLGSPVYSPLETDELMETQWKLNQAIKELNRSSAKKAEHSKWMMVFMDRGSEIEHEAFLALWLSRFVLPSSFRVISKSVFPIAVHLARGTKFGLAPAVLASIYMDLSLFKEKIVALSVADKWVNKAINLEITIRSPFQLVQIWAWERFTGLRPAPNLIKNGEPRFAQWHKLMMGIENVRTVLDSAKECFDWRPYAKTLNNWKLPMFYGENEIRVSVDADLSEELQSWNLFLRVSELVGVDCIEQYLPHRVAMQFGMDQDIPVSVPRVNTSPKIAWRYYCRPVTCAYLCVPSRLYEAGVTTRYLKWWKLSLSRVQSVSDGASLQEKNLSKGATESSFAGVNSSAAVGSPPKKAKTSVNIVKISKEKKAVGHVPASVELASKRQSPNHEVKKKANDSVPPGFPPKYNLVATSDSHAGGSAEIFPIKSETFSSTAEREGVKVFEPKSQTELKEKIIQNEPVKGGSEIAIEDSTVSKLGSSAHDLVRMQGSEGDCGVNDRDISELPELYLEEWVSRLERTVAKLKAERFGHEIQL